MSSLERRDFLKLSVVGIAAAAFRQIIKSVSVASVKDDDEAYDIFWREAAGETMMEWWNKADDPKQRWEHLETGVNPDDPSVNRITYRQLLATQPAIHGADLMEFKVLRPKKENYYSVNMPDLGESLGQDSQGTLINLYVAWPIVESALQKFSKFGKIELLLELDAVTPKGTNYSEIEEKATLISVGPVSWEPPRNLDSEHNIRRMSNQYLIRVSHNDSSAEYYEGSISLNRKMSLG